MTARCQTPVPMETLLAYHLGELKAPEEAQVEEHYFACPSCATRLEWLECLKEGVRDLVRSGMVTASVTASLLERGVREGLQVRRYRLGPGDQVACTASPTDDFVAIELELDVEPSSSIDIAVQTTFLGTGEQTSRTFQGLSVDRTEKELVLLFSGAAIRALPRTDWSMEAIVRHEGSERRVGPYRLEHTPWEELQ